MSATVFENGAQSMAVVHVAEASANSSNALAEIQSAIREIRHEINNPLTGALGNINLLLRRDDLDEKTRKRLTTAEQEIKKVSLIVLKLADLAPRGGDGSP
jgi:signal transduction histidine kinase